MENNRKKYNIAMLAMTLIYVALVAVFIMGAYVITDGIGWDFVGAIFIAIFSVPFFVTLLSVVLLISIRHLKMDKALPNQSFDVVIVRAAVLMMLLAAISGILFILTDTRVIRAPASYGYFFQRHSLFCDAWYCGISQQAACIRVV